MAFCSSSGFGRLVDTDVIYTGPSITCGGTTVNPGDTVREYLSIVFLCANEILEEVEGNSLPIPDGTGKKVAFVGSGTYTQAGGPDIVVPDGSMGILFWDGNEWSLSQSVELPTQSADGEIEGGDDRAISGDTASSFFEKNVGIYSRESNGTNPLDALKGTDRGDDNVWGQGFFRSDGSID